MGGPKTSHPISLMDITHKLEILAGAAKYDASCASSGAAREDSRGSKGVGARLENCSLIMRTIGFEPEYEAWRVVARQLLTQGVDPDEILWSDDRGKCWAGSGHDGFGGPPSSAHPKKSLPQISTRLESKRISRTIYRSIMKGVKKANFPSKICVVCGRPFTWRKKWEKVWDEVKFCSDRCRGNKT